MKVLLISPQGSNIYAKMKVGLPPLGIAYLAVVIREKGHEEFDKTDLGLRNILDGNATIQIPKVED